MKKSVLIFAVLVLANVSNVLASGVVVGLDSGVVVGLDSGVVVGIVQAVLAVSGVVVG